MRLAAVNEALTELSGENLGLSMTNDLLVFRGEWLMFIISLYFPCFGVKSLALTIVALFVIEALMLRGDGDELLLLAALIFVGGGGLIFLLNWVRSAPMTMSFALSMKA